MREQIGAGSMGEVLLCRDLELHRDVALKIMREDVAADSTLVARFENEVRVQGQLDHPAIVPVYDCGRGKSGFSWFTMKHVRGKSLSHVLARLRKEEPGSVALYGPRRILSAFATVCLAVAFAHARNIVHRDIKPSNVMLGDYGEVYLLDWGIARLPNVGLGPARATLPRGEELTLAGDIIGTLGYMAPEQLRGIHIDARADVYSLGAVLFEILTLERLHIGDSPILISSTLSGADARASKRAPHRDVPIELEELCVQATAMRPEDRPSAKGLHDRVQAFLDGQRDLEERQRQSRIHYSRAVEAYTARAGADGAAREATLRELSRALALDDANEDARGLLHELVTKPHSEDDEAVAPALAKSAFGMRNVISHAGILLMVAWGLFGVGTLGMGVRRWGPLIGLIGLAAVCAGLLKFNSDRQRGLSGWAVLLAAELAAAASAAASGAFVLFPPILSCIGVCFALGASNSMLVDRNDRLLRMLPVGAIITTVMTFLVTALLELGGIAFPPIRFTGDEAITSAVVVSFPPIYTWLYLILTNTFLIAGPAALVLYARRLATRLESRALAEVAHLRPLVPGSSPEIAASLTNGEQEKR